jgi:hypothetical protein
VPKDSRSSPPQQFDCVNTPQTRALRDNPILRAAAEQARQVHEYLQRRPVQPASPGEPQSPERRAPRRKAAPQNSRLASKKEIERLRTLYRKAVKKDSKLRNHKRAFEFLRPELKPQVGDTWLRVHIIRPVLRGE